MADSLLELKNICKSYNNVPVLKSIDLSLDKAEILCVLGKNGAGKSTLVKILSGAIQADSGDVFIESKNVHIRNPYEAKKLGISAIHQDLNLFNSLSIAENICFGNYPSLFSRILDSLGLVSWNQMYEKARDLCEKYKFSMDIKKRVKHLDMGKKQIVAILKALYQESKILIMDEPSSALPETDVQNLFDVIRQVKKAGISVIYITHNIDDIYRIGDRVVVINDGEIAKNEIISNTKANEIIHCMAGKDMKDRYPKLNIQKSNELLRVENMSRGGYLKNISFSLYKGEIVGLAGLLGSGRSSVAKTLFGADEIDSGNIYIKGMKVNIRTPQDAVENRISFIPEDRRELGIIPNDSISTNITIAHLKGVEYEDARWLINKGYEKSRTERYADRLAIKRNSIKQRVGLLSGGNQQKTLIARWLFADADILLLDEPTKGIDIAGKVEIYNIMNELTREGKGILFISSDLSEILGMSDRILVMHNGAIVKQLLRNEATKELILYYASGGQ